MAKAEIQKNYFAIIQSEINGRAREMLKNKIEREYMIKWFAF